MAVIGIESSAHTFGVGIAEDGKVIANEKMMYHIGTTGMIPNKVAEFHIANANEVIGMALDKAKLTLNEIECVGYTKGPGMGPCLQVGELTAKTMAKRLGVPIIPVNHGIGHIEIARHYAKQKDPIALYVSGGNSQILKMEKEPFLHYRVLGETMDIGIGNMFDTFARAIKLDPAWGSTVEKVAQNGKYTELPYTVKGMDFSFTGLLTQATRLSEKASREDLCFSLREVSFSMLCEATERALMLTNSDEICVCGGVAQSPRLREMLASVAKEHGASFGFAPNEFNADNGGMIAFVAERMHRNRYHVPLEECGILQRYRIDEAMVFG